MKKYLSLLGVSFFILALGFAVNLQSLRAEDGQGSGDDNNATPETEVRGDMNQKTETMRDQARAKMDALRAQIKKERDSKKAKIEELRITGREKALERFDKVVARLTELKDKVDATITKFEAKGLAVTDAQASVATFETKLTAAEAKLVEINTLLAGSTNQLSMDDKTKLRTLVKDTQTLIVEAHQALKDAVKSLRVAAGLKMEDKPETDSATKTEDRKPE